MEPPRIPGRFSLVHGGGQPPHQVLEVPGEPAPRPGEGHPLGAHPMGRARKPSQDRFDLQAPPAQIEVPPRGGDPAGVVAGRGREATLGAEQLPASQLDGDHHPGWLEDHVSDRHPRQVHQALECSRDAHGIGLLGSVGLATPNLETTCARHTGSRRERRADMLRPSDAKREQIVTPAHRNRSSCPTRGTPWSSRRDHPHPCPKTQFLIPPPSVASGP